MDLIAFSLEPVAPFRLDLTVWALRRRPENTIDRWDGSTYRRILIAQEHPVEVEIIQTGPSDKPLLRIATTGARLSPDTKTLVISALTRMLGINADLTGFYRFAEHQPKLDAIARQFKGVKPPRFPTVFEALVHAIACQQVSQTVGILFINRLAQRYARSIEKQGEVFHGFPDPEDLAPLAPEALRTLGLSYQKSRAIIELASAIAEKRLNFDELNNLDNQTAVDRLVKLRGVGRWTAEYVLLRGVGRRQVFPGDDVGARNNLQRWLGLSETLDYQGVRESIAPWSTYGGLIYFHLLLKRLADAGFLDSGKETGRRDD